MKKPQWGMTIYDIDRFCNILYGTIKNVNTCLSFTFDTMPTLSLSERLRQLWYYVMIASIGEQSIVLITNDNEEITTKRIHNRTEFKNFINEYCIEHCPEKFLGYLCVDTEGHTNIDVQYLDFDV